MVRWHEKRKSHYVALEALPSSKSHVLLESDNQLWLYTIGGLDWWTGLLD